MPPDEPLDQDARRRAIAAALPEGAIFNEADIDHWGIALGVGGVVGVPYRTSDGLSLAVVNRDRSALLWDLADAPGPPSAAEITGVHALTVLGDASMAVAIETDSDPWLLLLRGQDGSIAVDRRLRLTDNVPVSNERFRAYAARTDVDGDETPDVILHAKWRVTPTAELSSGPAGTGTPAASGSRTQDRRESTRSDTILTYLSGSSSATAPVLEAPIGTMYLDRGAPEPRAYVPADGGWDVYAVGPNGSMRRIASLAPPPEPAFQSLDADDLPQLPADLFWYRPGGFTGRASVWRWRRDGGPAEQLWPIPGTDANLREDLDERRLRIRPFAPSADSSRVVYAAVSPDRPES